MNAQGTERTEKRLCVGLLAHVDAGKTTLSEAMLYRAGVIRTLGRVDHGDTFLDTDAQERSRGITIFSKQAVLPLPGCTLTLLDTPGHVDFSAEMERTLQVLDCAVLIISGPSGIQSHTVTLWRLLRRYQVPVQISTALTSGATHVLQWGVQRAATTRVDANPQNLSQFGLESATRLHEAGFASNRASATAR